MELSSHQLEREGFCLLGLCGDLEEFIRSAKTLKTYPSQTKGLLDYVDASLAAIKTFVQNRIEPPVTEDDLIRLSLRDFGQIRRAFSWLYVLTKQAVDSDSLSIPFPLAIFLNHLVGRLLAPKKVSLAVVSSSDLMYYKYDLKKFRELTQSLSDRIENYPGLSDEIGILIFPYCASHEILLNCNLFHEMGHYLYEITHAERRLRELLVPKLAKLLVQTFGIDVNTPEAELIPYVDLGKHMLKVMFRWADEIFADIFAVRTLGPAFHLAFLELEQIIPVRTTTMRRAFSETHPADDFRFMVQGRWLKHDGWDSVLQEETPSVLEELSRCAGLGPGDFCATCRLPSIANGHQEGLLQWMLQEFHATVVCEMEGAVSNMLSKSIEEPFNDFKEKNKLVTAYLEHGVVPSTLYDKDKRKHHPRPTTVLNAGFFFYLRGMDELLKRVQGSASRIVKRMACENRLNGWLGKAIDDWQVLVDEGKL
jgi:hypothetical protein